jgi:hypothetical protein
MVSQGKVRFSLLVLSFGLSPFSVVVPASPGKKITIATGWPKLSQPSQFINGGPEQDGRRSVTAILRRLLSSLLRVVRSSIRVSRLLLPPCFYRSSVLCPALDFTGVPVRSCPHLAEGARRRPVRQLAGSPCRRIGRTCWAGRRRAAGVRRRTACPAYAGSRPSATGRRTRRRGRSHHHHHLGRRRRRRRLVDQCPRLCRRGWSVRQICPMMVRAALMA